MRWRTALLIAGVALASLGICWATLTLVYTGLGQLLVWFRQGGSQAVEWSSSCPLVFVNARLLATLLCLMPLSFVLAGIWLCCSGLRESDDRQG